MRYIRRHPFVVAVASFVCIGLPQAIESLWSLFSSEPLVPTLAARLGVVNMSDIPLTWLNFITLPIGALLLLIVIVQLKKKPGKSQTLPPPLSDIGSATSNEETPPNVNPPRIVARVNAPTIRHTSSTTSSPYLFVVKGGFQTVNCENRPKVIRLIWDSNSQVEFIDEPALPKTINIAGETLVVERFTSYGFDIKASSGLMGKEFKVDVHYPGADELG